VHSITAPPFLCLAGAFHCRAMVFLFGRRISSPRRFFFVRPAHPIIVPQSLQPAGTSHRRAAISLLHSICLAHLIAAPHSLCPAGASHHRAAISSAGRLISLPHRNLFAAIYSFAGAFATDPPILCWSIWPAHSLPSRHRFGVVLIGWRIPRRAATDLVLFHLAGAFPTEPPPIWCCFIWPAHSLPSRHRFGVVLLGRRIPRQFGLFVCRRICCQPTDLVLLHLAGASPRRTTIAHFGRRIPLLRQLCLSRLAHPIAHFCRRIPLPCHHRSFWSAHPLAVPPLPT